MENKRSDKVLGGLEEVYNRIQHIEKGERLRKH